MSDKRKPYYLYHIKTPLLNRNWNLIFADNMAEAFKENEEWHETFCELSEQTDKGNNRETESWLNQTTAFVVLLTKSNRLYMILPKNASHDLIAHEAFHLALMIGKYKGLELTDSSEEAYAYLLQHIVKTVNKWKKHMAKLDTENTK